jgi:O-antigen/teichoic acid export membrane protein
MPLVIVRLFTQEEFGAYKQAFMVVNTAVITLPFSFVLSAFYFLPRRQDASGSVIFTVILHYAAVSCAAVTVLAVFPGLLTAIVGKAEMASLAPLVGAVIGLWVFSSLLESIATANQDVYHSTIFVVCAQFTKALLLAGSAFVFGSVRSVLYAAVVQGVLQSCILLWYVHKCYPFYWRHWDRELAAAQFRYVLPLGFINLVVIFQGDLHNYVVAHSFSTADYAIYAIGTAQLPLLGILRDSIFTVMQPRLNELHHRDERGAMLAVVLRSWRTLALVLAPAFVFLMLLSREVITIMYTSQYVGSAPIFRLNLTLLLLSVFIADPVLRTFAEYRYWFVRVRLISLAGQIGLSFICVRYFGMAGALIAMFVTAIAERLVVIRLVFRLLGFSAGQHEKILKLVRIMAVSAISGGVMWAGLSILPAGSAALRFIAGAALFGTTYLIAILLSGSLDAEERSIINRYAGKVRNRLRYILPAF